MQQKNNDSSINGNNFVMLTNSNSHINIKAEETKAQHHQTPKKMPQYMQDRDFPPNEASFPPFLAKNTTFSYTPENTLQTRIFHIH